MEGNIVVIYNVAHESPLGLPIAIYFYLTGLSAGSFTLSTLAYGFGLTQFKAIGKVGVVAAVLLLALIRKFEMGSPEHLEQCIAITGEVAADVIELLDKNP
ncbi:MAG: polysulfide reductase NrfD [Chloroflexi bacterium]|nr:polysulfide reductase NrfD [Chloroflexota bacterium]MCL5108385.1 polysulfide reductase NrfD [Chloroflexota bacterium]